MKELSFLSLALILLAGCIKEDPLVNKPEVTFEARSNSKVKAPANLNEVEILESNSDFVNEIWLVSPVVFYVGTDDAWGTVVALPSVTKNVELIFEIRPTFAGSPTGDGPWQTGPGVRNPDGRKHAEVVKQPDKSSIVSFEDTPASAWGMADEPNFVDAIFHVRAQP